MTDTLDWAIKTLEEIKRGYKDPQLRVFMARGLTETKRADLDDLAWALSHGNCSRGDAIGFFELLIKFLSR
jgi:hypothetical protein